MMRLGWFHCSGQRWQGIQMRALVWSLFHSAGLEDRQLWGLSAGVQCVGWFDQRLWGEQEGVAGHEGLSQMISGIPEIWNDSWLWSGMSVRWGIYYGWLRSRSSSMMRSCLVCLFVGIGWGGDELKSLDRPLFCLSCTPAGIFNGANTTVTQFNVIDFHPRFLFSNIGNLDLLVCWSSWLDTNLESVWIFIGF